jgi:hypothetical protein
MSGIDMARGPVMVTSDKGKLGPPCSDASADSMAALSSIVTINYRVQDCGKYK